MRTSFIIILLIALATSKRIEIRSKAQKNLIQVKKYLISLTEGRYIK